MNSKILKLIPRFSTDILYLSTYIYRTRLLLKIGCLLEEGLESGGWSRIIRSIVEQAENYEHKRMRYLKDYAYLKYIN